MSSDADVQLASDLHGWVEALGVEGGAAVTLAVVSFRGREPLLHTVLEDAEDFAVQLVRAARSACEMRGTRTTFEVKVGGERGVSQTFSMSPERRGSGDVEGPDPSGVIAQQMRHNEALSRMLAEFAEQSLREKRMLLDRIALLEGERAGVLEREANAMRTSVRAALEAEHHAELARRLEEGELDDDAAALERRVGVVARGASLVLSDLGLKEALTKKFEEIVEQKPDAAARVVVAMQRFTQEQAETGAEA